MAKVVGKYSGAIDQASAKNVLYAGDEDVKNLSGESLKKLEALQKGIDARKKNQDLLNEASNMVALKNPKRNESFGKAQNFSYTQTDLKRLKSFVYCSYITGVSHLNILLVKVQIDGGGPPTGLFYLYWLRFYSNYLPHWENVHNLNVSLHMIWQTNRHSKTGKYH